MSLPITSYVVMLFNEDIGAFAPAFQGLDEAEEFSNAMRLICDKLAVSEPVPIVATRTLKVLS